MNKITIGNMSDKNWRNSDVIVIRVDRHTVVGNPFFMKSENERDNVCDKYETFFPELLKRKPVQEYLDWIESVLKIHDVVLICWCYPKRCHAETIKKYLESKGE